MFGRLTVGIARYGVPGAVLGVILAWLSGTSGPRVQAQPTGPRRRAAPDSPLSCSFHSPGHGFGDGCRDW